MYNFFKNISEKNSCQLNGACSIHPSVNALYQVLANQIREISFYLVKLKEFNITDENAIDLSLKGLSIFLINTSYNQKKYLDFIYDIYSAKCEIKERYKKHCKENEFPCEIIDSNFQLNKNTTISELIKYAQNNIAIKEKHVDKTKQRLYELITIFARLCAIEVIKIKKLDKEFKEYDFEILRFFALTNSYSIRNEKIIRRIKEFSSYALMIMNKLNTIYETRYGKKESATPATNAFMGHCILVSGDDIDELEKLLKTIEKTETKEEINVYTNGALFLAHFYPYFKNNKYLKGHWGGDNAEYDFSIFPGSILITQNFIQKIDTLYRGEIFSNKLISFSKVFDITNDNYMPLIECSLGLDGFLKTTEKTSIKVSYDREKILKFLENFEEQEIIIISSFLNGVDVIKDHENKKILYLNCPLENDVLEESIKILQKKNVKITIFFAQCNLSSLNMLMALLDKNIELNIANCPHSLINPHVIESLNKDFNVNII